MAGTLPHAVFVETGIDQSGAAVAWAGELPGCAAAGTTPEEAVARVPGQVSSFVAWLRAHGEPLVEPIGNWYEVERVSATPSPDGSGRAAFSLDDLPPSADELATWLRWAEAAREELASALDANPDGAGDLAWLASQDRGLAVALGGDAGGADAQNLAPIDRLYAARDALMAVLARPGGSQDGVRRAIRLAIADDLRAAELLRGR